MPIYEYVCRKCGNELEKLQKLSDGPLTECPECGEPTLKRKVSAAGFRLAGGGWYETDFKSDGRRNIAGKKSDAASQKGSEPSENKTGNKAKTETAKSQGADGT